MHFYNSQSVIGGFLWSFHNSDIYIRDTTCNCARFVFECIYTKIVESTGVISTIQLYDQEIIEFK